MNVDLMLRTPADEDVDYRLIGGMNPKASASRGESRS